MQLDRDKLVELLKMAFDEGWRGYKDLRDSAVEKLVVDFEATIQSREIKINLPLQENSIPSSLWSQGPPNTAYAQPSHGTRPATVNLGEPFASGPGSVGLTESGPGIQGHSGVQAPSRCVINWAQTETREVATGVQDPFDNFDYSYAQPSHEQLE